jgi:5-(carboxyamino)imidazole ribonucleotide mutase
LRDKMLAFQESLADVARGKGSTVRDGAAELRKG